MTLPALIKVLNDLYLLNSMFDGDSRVLELPDNIRVSVNISKALDNHNSISVEYKGNIILRYVTRMVLVSGAYFSSNERTYLSIVSNPDDSLIRFRLKDRTVIKFPKENKDALFQLSTMHDLETLDGIDYYEIFDIPFSYSLTLYNIEHRTEEEYQSILPHLLDLYKVLNDATYVGIAP